MFNMSKKTGQRGFTLIELMIVVAIIGILAAVAVPKFAEMIRKSKEGATKGSLSALRSSMTIYVSDNEGIQPLSRAAGSVLDTTFVAVMVPKYQDAIPTVKLGTYFSDSSAFYIRVTTLTWTGNRSPDTPTSDWTADSETSGWAYSSASDGVVWMNVGRTDAKNEDITTW